MCQAKAPDPFVALATAPAPFPGKIVATDQFKPGLCASRRAQSCRGVGELSVCGSCTEQPQQNCDEGDGKGAYSASSSVLLRYNRHSRTAQISAPSKSSPEMIHRS